MQEHPIPQDITGYRFHIIGSMTLKQFGELFLGVIVALIIYKTNLVFPIKWALVILAAGLGAAAAFLPIAERPLDHWILTFFKVLYKPTQFYWKKKASVPEAFLYQQQTNIAPQAPEIDLAPVRRTRIKEYLRSVDTPQPSDYDDLNQPERLNQIMEVFKSQGALAPVLQKKIERKPDLSVRVRALKADATNPAFSTTTVPNQEITVFESAPVDYQDGQGGASWELGANPANPSSNPNSGSSADSNTQPTPDEAAIGADQVQIPQTPIIKTENTQILADVSASSASAAINGSASGAGANNTLGTTNVTTTTANQTPLPSPADQVPQSPTTQVVSGPTTPSLFNSALPFPTPPDVPNKMVGMVLTPGGDLIPQAIVEIHDQAGTIVRAVKTNALGQFYITTPLENGKYSLLVEKEGLEFNPSEFVLTGQIVPPVEVRSI